MFPNGFGTQLVPGMSGNYEAYAKTLTWGKPEWINFETCLISSATVDAGNTPTTLLRPGLLMGKIAASGLWKEWSPTAVDGSQSDIGVLMQDVNMLLLGTATGRFAGYIITAGGLKAGNILVPGQSSYGLASQAYEHVLRKLLAKNFILDDKQQVPALGWREHRLNEATPTVVTAADQDVLFVQTFAGATTFTLPATALAGMRFGFYNAVDQDMIIASGTADKLIVLNDVAADSVALSTAGEKAGGMFEVLGLASGFWLVIPHLWEAQTVTIVTA